MDDKRFSERHGFAPDAAEITVRHDAPHDLRGLVVDFAYSSGLGPHDVRGIVCKVLMTRPDPSNWSAFPNVDTEVRQLLDNCEGVGWQLIDGRIEVRGPEAFEVAVRPAVGRLATAGLKTAAQEIHEALRDLARRPDPDITGAIQHSMAAAECVAREAANDPTATLGEILDRYPGLVPRPLDQGLKKIWGYASDPSSTVHGRFSAPARCKSAIHEGSAAPEREKCSAKNV